MKRNISAGLIATITAFSLIGSSHASMDDQTKNEPSVTKKKSQKKRDFVTAKITGRVMVDYVNARAKNADFDIDELELRRAYLGISGGVGGSIKYSVVGSISDNGDIGLVGATLDWQPKGSNFKLRLGQFKTPMSLDESTSSKYTSTLERAAFTDAMDIDRRLGVAVSHTGKKHTFSVGVFGSDVGQKIFSSGMAIAARATFTPIRNKDQILHLGTSIRYRTINENDRAIRYRQRPYTHVTGRIISTGRIAESDVMVGGEAAFIHKNFWAAGEYSRTNANCPTCLMDPDFNGYYAEAGVFFGGRKRYGKGSFSRPKVNNPVGKGGYGAVAFVVRFDSVDLNDGTIQGGDMDTLILGADYYPTSHTRIGINYFHSKAALGTRGSGLDAVFNTLRRTGAPTEKVRGAILRIQYDF